ncbi:hypothetical protein SAMN05421776_110136 [Nocardia farcinica]|uniref:Uncharacterized protein n=1 Tax=Nocardia farcinica TaxID=37329 RepID=A0A0H5NR70_NOCFR|nr:hypothetical protein [Nocardia farcinica]AXK85708.1 hypothetical protein DXT66_08760 [Nocardia farcinica]CRY77544.1 Uncharacterised protein [Nocardia farcinica]SIT31300.1 hypothetical protein SAMN05421776_110136 [Nocardia farcinica]
MKRLLTTGLVALATTTTAVAAAPAQAEGLALVDSPSTGSTEVVPECYNGPMVLFHGTGSATLDSAASMAAEVTLMALSLFSPGANTGSGDDAAVDGPCADPGERDKVTQFLTYLHSGSAHH